MLITSKDAETKLLLDLKDLWENDPGNRCLHLKLSTLQEVNQELVENIISEFRATSDERNARSYICQDLDVFIISRTMTQRSVRGFLAYLAPKLTPALMNSGLASLFEVGVDWPTLRNICLKKIEFIQIQAARQKAEQAKQTQQPLKPIKASMEIDQNLIQSIPRRRDQRNTTEILIVEDDALSQRLIANALKNYEISIASDGEGALMGYVNRAPDVLFLDIDLPDISGHEVLRKIFQMDPNAYVIMFSGNGDKENVMKAIELGAKGFVGKPFSRERLIQYIQKSPFIKEKTPPQGALV